MRNVASQTLFIKKSRKMHNLLARYLDRVPPRCSLVLFMCTMEYQTPYFHILKYTYEIY
nr:MAG TPA: hypothetical protein [Caudoviricetes sp.]